MKKRFSRTARAGAAAIILGMASTAWSGSDPQTLGVAWDASAPVVERLTAAGDLFEKGRVVEAREVLMRLRTAAEGPERTEVLQLLGAVETRIRLMGPTEIALQRAQFALSQGDLREAERLGNQVRRADDATTEQRVLASNLLDDAALMRTELEPMIGATLEQAVRDFMQGNYEDAKAGLASVSRSGVRLNREQTATLERYRDALLTLEQEQGRAFDAEYVPMSVLRAAEAAGIAATAQTGSNGNNGNNASGIDETTGEEDLFEAARRADAQRELMEANAAFERGEYATARRGYQRVLGIHSNYISQDELARATSRLNEATARLGVANGDIVGDTIADQEIRRSQIRAEVTNLLDQARRAVDGGRVEEARRALAEAQLRWNTNQALFSEDEFRATATQIRERLDEAARVQEMQSEEERRRAGEQARRDAEEQQLRLTREREERISELLDQLRALQREQRYEEAHQVARQVLFLDPQNPAAQLMDEVLQDMIYFREWESIQRQKGDSFTREAIEIQRGMIVPQDEIAYPRDWPAIATRRGQIQSFVESPVDREVYARLDRQRIPADFADATLENILQFIAAVTNLNLDVDWDSLSQIGIERDRRLSLQLREVPASTLLTRVLQRVSIDEFSRASWTVQDGIILVASDADLRRNTFIVIYDVRDLLFEVPNYEFAPELDIDQATQQGGGGGGGGGTGGIFDQDDDDEDTRRTEEEILRDLLDIIQENVDFEGWRENGGDTGIVQQFGGNLIITNTAGNHREIQRLLDKLREIRSIQITIEARFLQVQTDFFEQIGFDFDIYFNPDSNQVTSIQNQIGNPFGFGNPANAGNVALTPGSTGQFQVWQPDENGVPQFVTVPYFTPTQTGNFGTVPVQQSSLGLTNELISSASGLAQTILNQNPALSIAGTFLDDIQVDFLIEATQADRRNVVLQAPRLTFTNGKYANIIVNSQFTYISALNPVVGTSSVSFNPVPDVLNTGFSLVVGGVVSADRRYVTLDVRFSISELVDIRAVPFTAVAGGTGGTQGTNQATGFIELPETFLTRIQTGVTIPDKGTALLGGQRTATEVDVETGVPVLSKLPLINRFFTNTATAKQESSVLVLLRPKILIQSEMEEDAFPGLQDAISGSLGRF